MNWDIIAKNPWAQTVGGGILVAFFAWLGKRIVAKQKSDNPSVNVQQNASPVLTQNFHIHATPQTSSQCNSPQPQATPAAEKAEPLEHFPVIPTRPAAPKPDHLSDSDLEVCITENPDHGTKGLLVAVINHRATNLKNFRLQIRDIRSFDRRTSQFREGFGFKTHSVRAENVLLAGDRSTPAFLVRVFQEHLELGDSVGREELRWPSGDSSDEQRWRLDMVVESDGIKLWAFAVFVDWAPNLNALRGAQQLRYRM